MNQQNLFPVFGTLQISIIATLEQPTETCWIFVRVKQLLKEQYVNVNLTISKIGVLIILIVIHYILLYTVYYVFQ